MTNQNKKMTPIEFIKTENEKNQGKTVHAITRSFKLAFALAYLMFLPLFPVVVWSKSYCPYCKETKKLFKSMKGVNMVVYELDQMKDGFRYQQDLLRLTGQRSVPNVFVNGRHVGGNDDTQLANQNGTLRDLLFMESVSAM